MVGHEVFISQMKDQIRIFQKQNRGNPQLDRVD
jgi:hypothetical protein